MTTAQHTILFVDDEPWLSEALRLALEGRGFNCVSKEDVTSALHYLEANSVSVLVTDIMMPGGPDLPHIDSLEAGFHFVSQVRRGWPSVSVICLSVICDQQKIRALKKLNVQYLRKGETPLKTAIALIESKATGRYSF
jgi:DNA-binding NarL/FixJ family response regulator